MTETEKLVEESVSLLKQMIAIPSVSFGEENVRKCISSFLDSHGIPHTAAGNNIIARSSGFDDGKKTLMLCAHMDTVSPADDYTFEPYFPEDRQEEDIIRGLGSNDDGASVVSMTAAFRYFHDRELPFNLMLVLTCEEEKSGPGGMTMLWGDLVKADWAIIGEPTGMLAATSERGLLVIDAEAHGMSGHAARNEGLNAIYVAMEDIRALLSHRFTKKSYKMGDVRLNVTQINAGTAHNVVPDKCTFVVDIRPTEMYTNEEIMAELSPLCKSTLKARNLKNRSSATREGSPLEKCLGEMGIGTFSSPTTSDWIRIGCDAVKMGPGDSARSHRKDEFVRRGEIVEAVGIYINFIENFAKAVKQDTV